MSFHMSEHLVVTYRGVCMLRGRNQLPEAGQIPALILNPMRRKGRGGKRGRKSKRMRSLSLVSWFPKKTPSILFGFSIPTPSILSHDLLIELGLQDFVCL